MEILCAEDVDDGTGIRTENGTDDVTCRRFKKKWGCQVRIKKEFKGLGASMPGDETPAASIPCVV